MNYLAFSYLLLPSLLAASEHMMSIRPSRDPFRTLQQDQSLDPQLSIHRPSPRTPQQLRQWQLQGVLGNPNRGLWGLVHTSTGAWRCLRVGESLLGYRVVDIDPQRVLLQKLQPSSDKPALPLILSWIGNPEVADLAVEQR